MKNASAGRVGGFTLIELLVVVLIIGILASVALPQYTKAVRKSRAATAWPILKAMDQAVQSYCLANPDSDTTDASVLDISFPAEDKNFYYGWGVPCTILASYPQVAAVYARGKTPMYIGNDIVALGMRNGKRICGGQNDNEAETTKFCQSLGMTHVLSASAPPRYSYCGLYPSHNCYTD